MTIFLILYRLASREYFQTVRSSESSPLSISSKPPFRKDLHREVLSVLESQLDDPVLRSNFNHTTLFDMALTLLSQGGIDVHVRAAAMLLEAARRSHIAVQAIMRRILSATPDLTSQVSEDEVKKWLFNGAKTGSLIATEDLRGIDPFQADQARREFVKDGGYNQNMSSVYLEPLQWLTSSQVSSCPEGLLDSRLDNSGNRPLHYAAAFGDTAMLSVLLQLGAQINAVNDQGETALYKACLAGNASVIPVFADFHADAGVRVPDYGVSCLHWLFNFDEDMQSETGRLLVAMGANIASYSHGFKDADDSDRSYPSNSLPWCHFPFHWPLGTPLHWATFARRPSTCDILLSLGSDINHLDVSRHFARYTARSSLSVAAVNGDSLMISYLLSRKAIPTQHKWQRCSLIHLFIKDDRFSDTSPTLHWWIFHGSWEAHLSELTKCVKLLSSAGADLNGLNSIGHSAFDEASLGHGNGALIIALLRCGAHAICRRQSVLPRSLLFVWCYYLGENPTLSYRNELEGTFEAILQQSQDFTNTDDDGENILHMLSAKVSVKNFKYLVSRILPRAPDLLEATDQLGRTPLLCAADNCCARDYYGNSKTKPEILLDLNANILVKSSNGVGFLQIVCSNRRLSDTACLRLAQRYLRTMDSNIEKMSYELECALRGASATLKFQVIKLLIPLVQDINSPNGDGLNSFDLAIRSAHALRLRKLTEWIDEGILVRDKHHRRCYFTGLQDSPSDLEITSEFLKNEKALQRLFAGSWKDGVDPEWMEGVQSLDSKLFNHVTLISAT